MYTIRTMLLLLVTSSFCLGPDCSDPGGARSEGYFEDATSLEDMTGLSQTTFVQSTLRVESPGWAGLGTDVSLAIDETASFELELYAPETYWVLRPLDVDWGNLPGVGYIGFSNGRIYLRAVDGRDLTEYFENVTGRSTDLFHRDWTLGAGTSQLKTARWRLRVKKRLPDYITLQAVVFVKRQIGRHNLPSSGGFVPQYPGYIDDLQDDTKTYFVLSNAVTIQRYGADTDDFENYVDGWEDNNPSKTPPPTFTVAPRTCGVGGAMAMLCSSLGTFVVSRTVRGSCCATNAALG